MERINIITPQFERSYELDYKYVPKDEDEFYGVINDAPVEFLKGCGFGLWDKMDNVVAENVQKPKNKYFRIPIINSDGEAKIINVGRKNAPTKTNKNYLILLFPNEWYNAIPNGFKVTGLSGEQYPFKKGDTDDDIRFGCLAYGILRSEQ